jgi:thioester reductase-like protein
MAATFQRLETIESRDLTVINCAAIVKHFAPKDMMERINVDAVRRLADFCSRHNARMTHISTLNTVMPTTEKQHPEGQYITEATFTPLPSTANPYTTTKWKPSCCC